MTDGLNKAFQLYRDAVEKEDLLGAVVLISDHEKILFHEAVGVKDKEKNLPMEKDTLFAMASITKTMTAAAILILENRNQLVLNDPVYQYIPSWEKGLCKKVTIRQLLNHTSGFRLQSIFVTPMLEKSKEHPDAPNIQLEASRFAEIGPEVEPGTSHSYNNPGYNTLGALVEIVSGKTFEQFLQEEIHNPLGMKDSYHNRNFLPDRSQLAKYYEKINGEWVHGPDLLDFPIVVPAGSLVSPGIDYIHFGRLFLNQGKHQGIQILKEESIKEATQRGITTDYMYLNPSQYIERNLVLRWYHLRSGGSDYPGDQKEGLRLEDSYGYGWALGKDGISCHGGALGTFVWVDPNRGIVGLILTQNVGGKNPGIKYMEAVNNTIPIHA